MAPFVPPVVTGSRVSLFGGAAVLPCVTRRDRPLLLAVLSVRPHLQVGTTSHAAGDGRESCSGSGSGSGSIGADPGSGVHGAGRDGSSSGGRLRAAVPGFGESGGSRAEAGGTCGTAAHDSTAEATSSGLKGKEVAGEGAGGS